MKRAASAEPLKVGTYGGYFQDSFDQHILSRLHCKDTGIEIESIGQPTGEAWVVQLESAARGGEAPADISMMAHVPRLKGQNSRLWAPLDEAKASQYGEPCPITSSIATMTDRSAGSAPVSWYITLRDQYRRVPRGADKLGRRSGTRPTRTASHSSPS